MKLILNEMWSLEIARQLRARGHDVVAATEHPRRYRSVSDREFVRRAQSDGRAIVTENIRDFMPIAVELGRRGATHFEMIFALRPSFDRNGPRIVGEMTRALDALLQERQGEEPTSEVVFLRG